METLYLSQLESDLAAALLIGLDRRDPSGQMGPGDIAPMTQRGQCFAATTDKGQAVYVVEINNGVAWVSACKGAGPVDWTNALLPVIEAQARGLAAVAFQTERRGLVRKAQRQGYEVTGYILKKKLQ